MADLDGQIYRTFASTGAVLEDEKSVRAQSAEHLKTLLNKEDHRYLFTLIQKFRTEEGETYPKLSDRSDIIVITDEAHRSQYDQFALNMRNALPNAAFIGFTGTPLMAGEERTKQDFGDYVSIYNFKQSIDDGNTVWDFSAVTRHQSNPDHPLPPKRNETETFGPVTGLPPRSTSPAVATLRGGPAATSSHASLFLRVTYPQVRIWNTS